MRILVDTNILLRWLVQDNEDYSILTGLITDSSCKSILVPDVVLTEIVWVLQSHYMFERKVISEAIALLLREDKIECDRILIEQTHKFFVTHPALSFVDCLLLAITKLHDNTTLKTLDKKLARVTKNL